jgi:hypothetical protein
MKHAVEMGSGVMMFLPSFMKIDSAIQKITMGMHRHTERMVSFYCLKYGKQTKIFVDT